MIFIDLIGVEASAASENARAYEAINNINYNNIIIISLFVCFHAFMTMNNLYLVMNKNKPLYIYELINIY